MLVRRAELLAETVWSNVGPHFLGEARPPDGVEHPFAPALLLAGPILTASVMCHLPCLQMLLALRPAKELVWELAHAVLRRSAGGPDSAQFRAWGRFNGASDKKLRGLWLWESLCQQQLLPQLLA